MGGGVFHSMASAAANPKDKHQIPCPPILPGIAVERISRNGERYLPHRFADGLYRVADPRLGRKKHHAANQIAIREEEIVSYLRMGYLLRMRGEVSGQVNLISPAEINFPVSP